VAKKYGLGYGTAPRHALLMHHTEFIPLDCVAAFKSIGKTLFGRALRDYEQSQASKAEPGPLADPEETKMHCSKFVSERVVPKLSSGQWALPRQEQHYWEYQHQDDLEREITEHLFVYGVKKKC
jgi:hypothetical protein